MTHHIRPPRLFGSDVNPDSRSPRDGPHRNPTILDEQPIAEQIEPVLRQRNAHRQRQIARTSAEVVHGIDGAFPPPPHHVHAVQRFERPNENRRRRSVRLGDDVDQTVDAVIEIDVGMTGGPV